MASITSLMNSSSSTSSLYGNRNVISGLASGMDTESMIENSVAGYKTKITGLQQKMTKLQWKQDAYRSLITQMNNVLNKYMSYTSSTNLFSSSFFSKAVNAVAGGANASKVAVTGKASSDVQIDSIKQLAQAASYTVSAKDLAAKGAATSTVDWNQEIETSNVSGSISFQLGGAADSSKGTRFTLRFEEDEVYKNTDELVEAVNKKLDDLQINGKSASGLVKAVKDGGKVKFEKSTGDHLEIVGAGGDMAQLFKKDEDSGKYGMTSEAIGSGDGQVSLYTNTKRSDYLKDQSLSFTVNGKTKNISLAFAAEKNVTSTKEFAENLQKELNLAFGEDKVYVDTVAGEGGKERLVFGTQKEADGSLSTPDGTILKVAGNDKVNETLGLGGGGYSNTVQTGWTLDRVLGDSMFQAKQAKNEDGTVIPGTYIDANGKQTTNKADAAQVATIKINGVDIELNKDDTIQNMMDKIGSSDAGVEVKYSSLTGEFSFTAKETGADSKIILSGDAAKALFGMDASKADDKATGKQVQGQDAIFDVTVNGKQMQLTRSSNNVDLDGYNVTLKETFGTYNADGTAARDAEAITFKTNTDSDKIVDAVKDFVKDYNEMVTAIRNAYTTEPLKNSKKEEYQPLTDEDQEGMSETAIKNYEEKAKTGLLYADTDLANLYSKLTSAVQGTGGLSSTLRSIGIDVSYSNNLTTLSLDEDKLRSALESDPDKVKDAFTQTVSGGASTNGMMANLRTTLQSYANTSIGSPGILVNKAGTTLSSYSLNNNELNDQITAMQEEIEKWQDRMSDRVDYYTNQFTQLELLINQMNSQSSMLAGLSGGM